MELAAHVEVEDDAFFADLSKQISLLIMDDEEDSAVHCPSISLQVYSQAIHPTIQTSISYQQTWRRESKGTGVFIPRNLSQPRRKNRHGRTHHSSNNTKFPKQSENSRTSQHVICNNINDQSSYDSFNYRRFQY